MARAALGADAVVLVVGDVEEVAAVEVVGAGAGASSPILSRSLTPRRPAHGHGPRR